IRMADEPGYRGVVDQNVQPSEFAHGGFDHLPAGGVIGDIGLDGDPFDAERGDLRGRLFGLIFRPAVIDQNRAPSTRQPQRSGAANASSASGDHGGFTFDLHQVFPLSYWDVQYRARKQAVAWESVACLRARYCWDVKSERGHLGMGGGFGKESGRLGNLRREGEIKSRREGETERRSDNRLRILSVSPSLRLIVLPSFKSESDHRIPLRRPPRRNPAGRKR